MKLLFTLKYGSKSFVTQNDGITFVYMGYYVIEHTSLAKYYILQKINMKNKNIGSFSILQIFKFALDLQILLI